MKFSEALATYQGFGFEIPEIEATGQITIITDETDNSDDALRMGFPRDLDGDGLANNVDVSTNYLLLPVKVEVQWTSFRGPQTRAFYCFIAQED